VSARPDHHTAFRKRLYFTVTTVTLPVPMGTWVTLPMRNPLDRHIIVTVTVTKKTA
jgi:hypothetical protein